MCDCNSFNIKQSHTQKSFSKTVKLIREFTLNQYWQATRLLLSPHTCNPHDSSKVTTYYAPQRPKQLGLFCSISFKFTENTETNSSSKEGKVAHWWLSRRYQPIKLTVPPKWITALKSECSAESFSNCLLLRLNCWCCLEPLMER